MAASEQVIRQAWRALRRTRRLIGGRTGRQKSSASGCAPGQAREALLSSGLPQLQVEAALHMAILRRFPAFADSWDSYVDQSGWLLDLLTLPSADRQPIVNRWHIEDLLESTSTIGQDPAGALQKLPLLTKLMSESASLQRRREKGEHPAGDLMVARYGLHPELAKAVLLHGRLEPWWAHIAITAAWFVCGAVFILALADPHNAAFENESVGGVGPMHYIVLPLFTLTFFALQVWLIITRPTRQRAWRAQLERWQQALDAESSAV